ncbi:hypothetical protein [Streptomyces violaceorubidus]|uniref:hypothetical protein n=1 Tax=Streptomyces violaceorubidus TaxID=284042 RepID=UPI0004C08FF5|nr:hypothetical protein [Streptomyces violaceorubidus]
MTVDLMTAYACRVAAVTACAGGASLTIAHEWIPGVLLLWLVPSLLFVAHRARLAHARTPQTGRTTR